DKSLTIARLLLCLGLCNEKSVWRLFSPKEILEIAVNDSSGTIAIPAGKYREKRYFSDEISLGDILQDINERHSLETSMFNQANTFEDAFNEYYDVNWPALICPNDPHGVNGQGPAVFFLLEQFFHVVQSGKEEDKQIVRDFFLSKKPRSLYSLCRAGGDRFA